MLTQKNGEDNSSSWEEQGGNDKNGKKDHEERTAGDPGGGSPDRRAAGQRMRADSNPYPSTDTTASRHSGSGTHTGSASSCNDSASTGSWDNAGNERGNADFGLSASRLGYFSERRRGDVPRAVVHPLV
jgi:hypothetical protein